jgi:Uma2 family endonuclease
MSAHSETWPQRHRLSVDDYYRMAETGVLSPDDRTELIDGEIIDMPPIGSRHADVVTMLGQRLVYAVGDVAQVRVQAPVRLLPRSEPQPDIAVVTARQGGYRNAHPGAADVLVLIEVSDSTLRYDLEIKARLYAKHGIAEYWVVDLESNRVHRHRRPGSDGYGERDEITDGTLPLPAPLSAITLDGVF